MASHLLFVDDSGTKEYASSVELHGKSISRSLVFGGVLLPARAAGAITSEMVSLKIQAFGSPHNRDKVKLPAHPTRDQAQVPG
jgi:hypothetical protein